MTETQIKMKWDAIKEYSDAINRDPNVAGQWSNRGHTYYALGKYREALQDFLQCRSLNPNYPHIDNNIGSCKDRISDE